MEGNGVDIFNGWEGGECETGPMETSDPVVIARQSEERREESEEVTFQILAYSLVQQRSWSYSSPPRNDP